MSELVKNLVKSLWTRPLSDVTLVHVCGSGPPSETSGGGGGRFWRLIKPSRGVYNPGVGGGNRDGRRVSRGAGRENLRV